MTWTDEQLRAALDNQHALDDLLQSRSDQCEAVSEILRLRAIGRSLPSRVKQARADMDAAERGMAVAVADAAALRAEVERLTAEVERRGNHLAEFSEITVGLINERNTIAADRDRLRRHAERMLNYLECLGAVRNINATDDDEPSILWRDFRRDYTEEVKQSL